MANTLTGLIPIIYAALNTVQRELIGFIPSVSRDPDVARAAKGQTVRSFVTPVATAADITPGVTAPNDGDQVMSGIDLTIDKSRYVPIRWNGEEQLSLNNGGPGAQSVLQQQFAQGFRTLINEVEMDIALKGYKAASRAYGTAGTAPFGTAGDLSDIAGPMQILDDNGAPMMRELVLGSAAMANIRGKQSVLFKANEAGTDELLREGTIGRLEGASIHNSPGVRPVTKGTGAAYVTGGGGPFAVGTTSIPLVTGTGTVLAGDIVTFAGDTNKYVVVAGVAAPGTITLGGPGLRASLASGVAMTVGNSYTPNLLFSSDAIVLATRTPAVPVDATGVAMDMADDRTIVTAPYSGISFEVALYRQYRQIKYEIGLAWGVGAVKSDNIAILIG